MPELDVSERAELYTFVIQRWARLFLTVSLAVSFCACEGKAAQDAAEGRVRPSYDEGGHLKRLEYDSNGDGKIDTWGYMDGTRIVRLEADENGDGKVDRWEYHAAGSAEGGSQGAQTDALQTLERVEEATHFDGRVDRREYYVRGELARREEDTDGDGKVDKWETYNAGVLTSMALDSQHRGKPDRRLTYRPDGTLERIETDPSGTGHFRPVSP